MYWHTAPCCFAKCIFCLLNVYTRKVQLSVFIFRNYLVGLKLCTHLYMCTIADETFKFKTWACTKVSGQLEIGILVYGLKLFSMSVVFRPGVPVALGICLEMHVPRPHSRPTGVDPSNLCFNKRSRLFWFSSKFDNHCSNAMLPKPGFSSASITWRACKNTTNQGDLMPLPTPRLRCSGFGIRDFVF